MREGYQNRSKKQDEAKGSANGTASPQSVAVEGLVVLLVAVCVGFGRRKSNTALVERSSDQRRVAFREGMRRIGLRHGCCIRETDSAALQGEGKRLAALKHGRGCAITTHQEIATTAAGSSACQAAVSVVPDARLLLREGGQKSSGCN